MEIKYNYNCSKGEAYRKIDSYLDGMGKELYKDLEKLNDLPKIPKFFKRWNDSKDKMDFELEIMGIKASGNVQLNYNELILNGKLPLIAKPFEGRIIKGIPWILDEVFYGKNITFEEWDEKLGKLDDSYGLDGLGESSDKSCDSPKRKTIDIIV